MVLYRLHLVERSAEPVVSLAEMKRHIRPDTDDDDPLIETYIKAATEIVEGIRGWTNRALVDQTWDMALERFANPIRIPLPPLIAVVSVKYYDADDVMQTLDESVYEVIGGQTDVPAEIRLKSSQSWPSLASRSDPVTIRFRAGYLDMGMSPPVPNVPEPIRQAIKLKTGTFYAHREHMVIGSTHTELNWAEEALLRPYRVYE